MKSYICTTSLQNYKKSMRVLYSGTLFPHDKTLYGFYLNIFAINLKYMTFSKMSCTMVTGL